MAALAAAFRTSARLRRRSQLIVVAALDAVVVAIAMVLWYRL